MSAYTDAEIQQSLNLYDLVLAIQSVKKLRLGWNVYGKRLNNALFKIFGRLVTFIGDSNAGKTFLIRKFKKDSIKLPSGHTVHTPGLCMILPDDTNIEDAADPVKEENVEVDTSKMSEREQMELLRQLELGQDQVPDEPKNVVNDVIYLDTQGTNSPCSNADLIDVRATEFLLRQLTLEIATRVIYVTAKFNRDTQIQIGNLIRQLDNIPEKQITPTNRLLIVHNWAHVTTAEELMKLVDEVKKTYAHEEPEQDERFKKLVSWMPEPFMGTIIYNGRRTIHFFLGNDVALADHNAKVIAAIEAKMYENNLPKEINLVQQVIDRANRLVEPMIKEWDHHLALDAEAGKLPVILPRANPTAKRVQGHFTLNNMQFLGYTIMSEGFSDLFGRVDISSGKMRVRIRCAGVNAKHLAKHPIRCDWDINNRFVVVRVDIPSEEDVDGWEQLQNTVKSGTGIYVAELPEDQRQLRFVPPRREDIPSLFTATDGVIEFSLTLADNINDYSPVVGNNNNTNGKKDAGWNVPWKLVVASLLFAGARLFTLWMWPKSSRHFGDFK